MAKQQSYAPPKRKEPGFIGKLFSSVVQLISWLIISLLLSIAIEWVGLTYYWPEEGIGHAKSVLIADQAYLNQSLQDQSFVIKSQVILLADKAVIWIGGRSWFTSAGASNPRMQMGRVATIQAWVHTLFLRYHDYIQASMFVSQIFVIRLALILFSLPIFLFATLVGAIDGLVERDLRRWGGGRESSNVFNLAKKSITPAFVLACVVYISLPFSVNPVLVILPFAIMQCMAVRITFERLKKYF